MELAGYFDIGTKRFTSSLDENASVGLPVIVAGEDITLRVKFKRTRDDVTDEVNPTVVAMKAMLGQVDVRPLQGEIKLTIDAEEFANPVMLSPGATGVDSFEVLLKAAIEALTVETGTVNVAKLFDSYILTFNTNPEVLRDISVTYNTLFPSSFLHVRAYMRAGRYEYDLRAVKAPVSFTNTFRLDVGPLPTIQTVIDGGEIENSKWREVQKLVVPPSFTGTFRIMRGLNPSEPLSRDSSLEEIAAAVEPLKDPGGVWEVTFPVSNTFYFYFGGDMEGINQPEMTVDIFDPPPAENVLTMTTATREMAEVMMEVDQAVLALEVYAIIEDLEDPSIEHIFCVLRQNLGILEAVDRATLATAPGIDWLNPPTLIRNRVFSPSQISNGQLHASGEFGDGAGLTFQRTHGLNTLFVDLIILENQSPGSKMIEGTHYTWERDNADQVTITWLGTTPTISQYTWTVLGLAQTSFFDVHNHTIPDVDGLAEWIATAEARFALFMANTALLQSRELSTSLEEAARWQLPVIWELYPSSFQPSRPADGKLSMIDLEEKNPAGKKLIDRGRGLLPAIHGTAVTPLFNPPPSPIPALVGGLFQNQTVDTIQLSGGYGLRTLPLAPGEYAACDGRMFYPVVPRGRWSAQPITTAFATSAELFTFTSPLAEMLADGTQVEVASSGVLPAGLLPGTTYYVRNPNFVTHKFALSLAPTGALATLTSDGTGQHSLLIESNITWYPMHFDRTLATIAINDKQLRAGKDLYVGFGLEAALLQSNVDAQIAVIVEIGEARRLSAVGTENDNLDEIVWRRIPALEQVIVLSPISTTHQFGLRVSRRILEGVDTLTCNRMLYGAEEFGVVPPRTANFTLRIGLGKFDTSGSVIDSKGLLILSGLSLGGGSSSPRSGNYEIGAAVIK